MPPIDEDSPPGDGADDHERLVAARYGLGQVKFRPLERQIVLAGEEAQKRTPLLAHVIANRPLQHRVARLDGVEYRAERDRSVDGHLDLAADAGQRLEMLRQLDAD